VTVRSLVQFEGSKVDREEPVVQSAAKAVREPGVDPEYEEFTGGIDAHYYLNVGIPTIVFDPGPIVTAH